MRAFHQVDVFTDQPYLGNALAVVMDGSGLSQAQMQQFARWTNLSETTFLLPATNPAADYQVRIFTPGGELPFAGHPTLGSCHAWLQSGGQPQGQEVVQQCAVVWCGFGAMARAWLLRHPLASAAILRRA